MLNFWDDSLWRGWLCAAISFEEQVTPDISAVGDWFPRRSVDAGQTVMSPLVVRELFVSFSRRRHLRRVASGGFAR